MKRDVVGTIVEWADIEGRPSVRCGQCGRPVYYGLPPSEPAFVRCRDSGCKKWNRIGGNFLEKVA